MDSKRIGEMMEAAEAFLGVATYLTSRPPYQVPVGSLVQGIEEAKDKQIWSSAVTSHMLYAIVFEIAIKVIWALDNRRDFPFTHNIAMLYEGLSEESPRDIEGLSEESRRDIEEIYSKETVAFAHIKNEISSRFSEDLQFHSLKEALIANEDTMKTFKYSNKFEGKSSILGSLIWCEETVWALPSLKGAGFPEALYSYTLERVEQAKRSASTSNDT